MPTGGKGDLGGKTETRRREGIDSRETAGGGGVENIIREGEETPTSE